MPFGPIDYSINVETPFQAAAQGYQLGAGIRDDQFKQQQQQVALQQAAQQRQVIQSLISNPAAGAKEYADAALIVPSLRENFKQAWDQKSAAQQESTLRDAGQAYSAVVSGKPEIAVDMLTRRADAMEAAGANPREIQAARAQAQIIREHPEFARTQMGLFLASVPGGDKVLSGATTIGTEARAQAEAPYDLAKKKAEAEVKGVDAIVAPAEAGLKLRKGQADIDNIVSTITERGARLGLDRDRLTTETQLKLTELNQKFGQLPDDARKNLNESSALATASEQGAQQTAALADKLEALDPRAGKWGTVAEAWKAVTGTQDEVTALRQEYTRIRSQGVSKLLPPGPASDKDIQIAMSGFPSDTTKPEMLASFLRGMSKLQTYDAVLNSAKAQWFGEVQHLGATKRDLTIDGVQVPAGTNFNDFARQYVSKKAGQINGANLVNSLAAKYGAVTETPAPPITSGRTPGFN